MKAAAAGALWLIVVLVFVVSMGTGMGLVQHAGEMLGITTAAENAHQFWDFILKFGSFCILGLAIPGALLWALVKTFGLDK